MRKKINLWVEGTGTTDWILRNFFESQPLSYQVNTIIMTDGQAWGGLCDGLNIFVRAGSPVYRSLPIYLEQIGIEYIYYIDDNFWEIEGNSLLANHYRNALVHSTMERFIRGAVIVITSSHYLKEYIESKFDINNVVFCQAPVDIEYIKSISNLNNKIEKPPLRIGYAGVPKVNDFTMVWTALKRIRENYPNVEIEFFGDGYDEYLNEERVTVIRGLSDLKSYYFNQLSRDWDIGLAPLLDNDFTKSKTENKLREYSAMKIAGIYSNIKIYNSHVTDGENGILADQNADSWYLAIERLINNSSLREKIVDNAFKYAQENFHFTTVADQWNVAINNVSFRTKVQSKLFSRFIVQSAFQHVFNKDISSTSLKKLVKFNVKYFCMSYLVKLRNTFVILLLMVIVFLQVIILLKK